MLPRISRTTLFLMSNLSEDYNILEILLSTDFPLCSQNSLAIRSLSTVSLCLALCMQFDGTFPEIANVQTVGCSYSFPEQWGWTPFGQFYPNNAAQIIFTKNPSHKSHAY